MDAKILVVVKDSIFKDALREKLDKRGFSVIAVSERSAAVEAVAGNEIDIVLLDIRNQGKEAMQTMTEMKQANPTAEVIMLASDFDISWSMEGMRQGAADDITVPFEIDKLIFKIHEIYRRKKSRISFRKLRSFLGVIENAMVAATFAQAGEFETAKEIHGRTEDDKSGSSGKRD
ncbi:MAG: response regulator [Proteobacteria bacterium]|nr:response regulator [Pseudomonadota bacterium]MBU1710710.1 response regulator [Pseudomonadota bacterium]